MANTFSHNENTLNKIRRRSLGRYRYVRMRWHVMFSLIDAIGGLLFNAAHVASILLFPFKSKQTRPVQRILIVQLDHIGDAVITSVMLPLLRRRYPQAAIEILCGPWNQVFFESIAEVDRVHVSRLNRFLRDDARSLFSRFAWTGAVFAQGLRLRRRRFDLAIDTRGEFPNALMIWIAGARQRLGWDCGGGGFLLTHIAPFEHGRPEVESRLALLAELGIVSTDATESTPRFKSTDTAKKSLAAKLDGIMADGRLGLLANEQNTARRYPWIVLHVSAGTAAKRWPVEHLRKLVDTLSDSVAKIILVGGPGDTAISQGILGTDCSPNVYDLTGRLDVAELAALLERADLFIGADSGPAHLAAAVSTPVIALFSGTNNHRQWRPHGPNVAILRHPVPCGPCHRERCPLPEHPCMKQIEPKDVARAAGRFIRIENFEETENHDSSASTAARENNTRWATTAYGT